MPTPPKKKPDVKKAPAKKAASKKSPNLKAQTPPKNGYSGPIKPTSKTKSNKGMVRRAASATPIYDSVVREKGFDPLGPKKKR